MSRNTGVQNSDDRTPTLRVLPSILCLDAPVAVEAPQVLPVLIARVKGRRVHADVRLYGFNSRVSGQLLHEVVGLLALETLLAEVEHV